MKRQSSFLFHASRGFLFQVSERMRPRIDPANREVFAMIASASVPGFVGIDADGPFVNVPSKFSDPSLRRIEQLPKFHRAHRPFGSESDLPILAAFVRELIAFAGPPVVQEVQRR